MSSENPNKRAITEMAAGGLVISHLAKVRKTADFPYIPTNVPKAEPSFAGTPTEFLKKHNDAPALKQQMNNTVKICPKCSKPNGFTLGNCNACGTDISSVERSYTNNIFMGFVYGIQKGPFPFVISIRHQCENFLVIDDLLALGPFHVNIIPTSYHIADWRFLLKTPQKGLELIRNMFELGWKVLKEQFLGSANWRGRLINNGSKLSDDEIKEHVIAGFNYPPSQYQLHLQFMIPPLMPFQHLQYVKGNHYTFGRFFPYQYVEECLKLNVPMQVETDTPVEAITHKYDGLNVNYANMHQQLYKRYGKSIQALNNWQCGDFQALSINNTALVPIDDKLPLEGETDVSKVVAEDKMHLQNYGRPYTAEGKPSGTYYKFAKSFPDGVKQWPPS